MPERAPLVGVLVDFAAELRSAGLAVGSGDVLTYCAALVPLDPTDLLDLYWAGRATLVTRRDSIPVYDAVFRQFFLGAAAEPVRELLSIKAEGRGGGSGGTADPGCRAAATGAGRRRCWA